MSEVSTISPASTSELPEFNLTKASSMMLMLDVVLEYSPLTDRLPVIVTSPVSPILPVDPVMAIGVFVTPPSLIVTDRSLSCDVCAIVMLPELAVIVNSCPSPIVIPELLSMVRAPVVVSAASALRKLPPAITEAEVFDVDDTSTADACDELPENDAPSVEFNVNPALIDAKPFAANGVPDGDPACGVNASLDNTATRMLPTYIDDMTLLTPLELFTVSIFHPDSVCPDV